MGPIRGWHGKSSGTTRHRSSSVIMAAKRTAPQSDPLRKGRGYIKEDNSGKANVFGTVPDKLYVSSPTADRISQSGIGGLQGITVLSVALAAVLVITTGVLRFEDGDDLKAVRGVPEQSTLPITPCVLPRLRSFPRQTH